MDDTGMGQKINGILVTYENNSMSLSCQGYARILKGVIVNISFKGYPRTHADGWTSFYKSKKIGDIVTDIDLKNVLGFNETNNVVSVFKEA